VTKFKATYILAIFTVLMSSCHITRNVRDGKYLVKKNKVTVNGDELDEDAVAELIRQPANFKTTGLKLKLMAYNVVDSTKVAEKRIRKNKKLDRKNVKKRARQEKINEKRIKKARKKNQEYYTKKIIPLKDTLSPKLFVREWLKYKYGEPPVIFDSTAFEKTVEQHAKYLEKKGYYYGNTYGEVKYKRRKKAKVHYFLTTGKRLFIDSVRYESETPYMVDKFVDYLKSEKYESLKGKPFDRDILDDYRATVAKTFRDDRHYGYSAAVISYEVDTNKIATQGVVVTIKFADRVRYHPDHKDSLISIKIQPTRVRNVYFHISDTSLFSGSFTDTMRALGLNVMEGQYLNDIDTLFYQEIFNKKKNMLATNRMATFLYNEKLFVVPGVIETQNYLEQGEWYKEYYVNRTYTRLMQLGLFVSIKPQIIEILGTNEIDVHYYLVPAEKESFGHQLQWLFWCQCFFGLC
jgi:outer membrane protein insertion porin family